ncbi:MAG: dihydrolipoyllysine-residue acetyltransferase [Gammaproteobacteria bacterium]
MAIEKVLVPDIGTPNEVAVIEVMVKVGDEISKDDSIITLESDKASMEVPSPFAGTVKEMKVKVGDKIKQDSLILTIETTGAATTEAKPQVAAPAPKKEEAPVPAQAPQPQKQAPVVESDENNLSAVEIHAGPAVRRYARELGVNLNNVGATGRKGRVLFEDVQLHVKNIMQNRSGGGSGLSVSDAPVIDFAKFGEVETKPLLRIKRLTGINLHRNWVTIPHVTQFDEADITELETFRNNNKQKAEQAGYKLTPLVFIMKAVVAALKKYPIFNSSLDASGENLIYKKYFHVGVAVDTPNGLVVPVIRDVDKKGLFDLADELSKISHKAREKGLTPLEMQGSCFSISSLGGIGGTAFTPIVNAPDVAILGVSKASMKPVYQSGQFVPRLMLPLSLSYDHRVIDGADGARFTAYLAELLADVRQLLF